jgi:hypothetical protein
MTGLDGKGCTFNQHRAQSTKEPQMVNKWVLWQGLSQQEKANHLVVIWVALGDRKDGWAHSDLEEPGQEMDLQLVPDMEFVLRLLVEL